MKYSKVEICFSKGKLWLLILPLLSILTVQSEDALSEPVELLNLRQNTSQTGEAALQPVRQKYLNDLERLQQTLTVNGPLEQAVTVKKEREQLQVQFAKALDPVASNADDDLPDTFPAKPTELLRLRQNYVQACEPVLRIMRQNYQGDLERLLKMFIAKGKPEQALPVKQEKERVQYSLEKPRDGSTSILATMVKTAATKTDQGYSLKKGGLLQSKSSYKPPIRITYVVKTDSSNIRIGYAATQIILNWNGALAELRIDGGPAGGQHKPGKGRVPTHRFVTIEQDVLPDRMVLRVDGVERAKWPGDFKTINLPISIFTEAEATITVKDVRVQRYPASANPH